MIVVAAAVWVAGYLVAYLAIIAHEGGSPAGWYIAVLVSVLVLLGVCVPAPARPGVLLVAAVLLGFACLVALLSIGVYLLPALVATAVAIAKGRPVTSAQ